MRFALSIAALAAFLTLIPYQPQPSLADARRAGTDETLGDTIYLPIVSKTLPPHLRTRVNLPYFPDSVPTGQAAIFWFGQVDASRNYADVRIAYTAKELWVLASSFDRQMWYDPKSDPTALTSYDAFSLFLILNGPQSAALNTSAYRFVGQISWFESRARYQAAYRWNGSGWASAPIAFTTDSGYRGTTPNSGQNSAGWAITFHIPYASLGLSGPPAPGSAWGVSMLLHDRDSRAGPPLPDQAWPDGLTLGKPSTWAVLGFGMPAYTPPASAPAGTARVRNQLNGVTVPDAAVGGTLDHQCPNYTSDPSVWDWWGNRNYAGATGLNIQNQSDLADWSCFSKYYVTFPLAGVPPGKVILSATLTLTQWGNSGSLQDPDPDKRPKPSYIQAFTLAKDWDERSLTWNNAPQALENVAGTWADLNATWDKPAPRHWDVTRAVAAAYAAGQPLRLALYEADDAYHSGKYFYSSEAGLPAADGRPTLEITWGN